MKHTKKRAILSAVAMLVVSAIALSSATFAWFSSGNSVGVNEVSAQVSNADGSILISANQTVWKTQLTNADISAVVTNILPANLIPVSATLSKAQVIGGSITDGTFTASGASTSGYIKYTAYLKATVDCTGTITPSFASTAGFVYGGVTQATNTVLLNGGGRSYYPIDQNNLVATDTSANDIIDPSEAPTGLGTQQTAAATGSIVVTMTANTVYAFTVYVWAEGQDALCRGTVPATAATMTVNVLKTI